MSPDPRHPFEGFRSPAPPEGLDAAILAAAEAVSGGAGTAEADGRTRHLVDRLWSSPKTWIGWAAACLALVALDLHFLGTFSPAVEASRPPTVAREADDPPCEQIACRLDEADQRLLSELDLDPTRG